MKKINKQRSKNKPPESRTPFFNPYPIHRKTDTQFFNSAKAEDQTAGVNDEAVDTEADVDIRIEKYANHPTPGVDGVEHQIHRKLDTAKTPDSRPLKASGQKAPPDPRARSVAGTSSSIIHPKSEEENEAQEIIPAEEFRLQAERADGGASPPSENHNNVQARFVVGSADSVHEREADQVADKVMAGSADPSSPPAISQRAGQSVQRRCAQCEQLVDESKGALCKKCSAAPRSSGDSLIQAKSTVKGSAVDVNTGLGNKINSLRNQGKPLPDKTLRFFNSRFKRDFSQVRIHTGEQAAETTRALNARAYTLENHIAFAAGQYSPHQRSGQRLLAHELTHVVQQLPHIARAPGDEEASCYRDKYADGQGTYAKGHDNYFIWGTWNGGESRLDWSQRLIRLWIKWRFGASVSAATESKLYAKMISGGFKEYDITPVIGCQYAVVVPIEVITALTPEVEKETRKKQTKAAGVREEEAGLPPPPSAEMGEAKGEPGGTGTAGSAKRKGEKGGEVATGRSGAEFEGGKGKNVATHPAIPMTISGLEIQPVGGTGTYRAQMDYSIAGRDRLSQVVEAMNWVNYHWEVYNITAIARAGLGKSFTETNKHNPLSEEAEVGKMEATGRRFERVGEELIEDTETSIKGLTNPVETSATGDLDELLVNAYANQLNLQLLPVSAILDYGGWAIGAFADLLSADSQEREIPWPRKSGIYMIRVIAQPTPQGRNDEMLRAPSVETKIVEVISTKAIAKEGLVKPKAKIAEKLLELEMARKRQPPDPKLIARLEKELADLKTAAYGSSIAAIKLAIRAKEEAASKNTGYQKQELDRQVAELKKQLALAEEREAGFTQGSWRLQASFASEITGQSYPLLLQLGERDKDGKKYVFQVSDVTSKSGEKYIGKAYTRQRAAWRAVRNFAGHNQYGRGYVVVHMPAETRFSKQQDTLRNAPTDTAIARKRLDDLVLALTALAMFVPGVGTAAAVLGAALAAERLLRRYYNSTLYFDAESISDFISLLGAAAQGASVIGKIRVIRTGDKFALASGKVNHTKLAAALSRAEKVSDLLDLSSDIIDWGGLAFGNLVTLDRLMEINKLELQGKISHAEARRQRASLLTSAIQENGLQLLNARKAKRPAPAEVPGKPGGTSEPPPKKKTTPAEPAAETPTKEVPKEAPTKPRPEAGKPEAEPGERAKEEPKPTTTAPKPLTGEEKVEARAKTPDKLHVITVLEDGRIIRCSMSCGEMRLHYGEFLNVPEDSPLHERAKQLSGKLAALEAEGVTDDRAQKKAVAEKTALLEPELRALAADHLAAEFGETKSSVSVDNLLRVFSPDEVRQLQTELGIKDLTKLGKPGRKEGSVQDRTLRLLSEALALSTDPETRQRILETVAGKRLTTKVETKLKSEIRAIERAIQQEAVRRANEAQMSEWQAERSRLVEQRDRVRKERKRLEAEAIAANAERIKYHHLSIDERDPQKKKEYHQKLREAAARMRDIAEQLHALESDSSFNKDIRKLDEKIELLDIVLNPESHRAWLPCFAQGTMVETVDGYRAIDCLQAGDLVMCYDWRRQKTVARPVMQTYRNITEHFYDISVGQCCIAATGNHPFWIEERQTWLPARQLSAGMRVRLSNGDTAGIVDIQRRAVDMAASYNLLVEQHHNYFVGDGVLVHNGGEGGAVDLGLGDLLIYRGTNPDPKFDGKVYIGQTDDLDREGEHRNKAEKELRRSDLTSAERYFWEFMANVELVPLVTGLDATHADYLEQRNMEIEIKLAGGKTSEIDNLTDLDAKMRGDTVLMNRRRQLSSSLESVTEKIVSDERVHSLGMCLD